MNNFLSITGAVDVFLADFVQTIQLKEQNRQNITSITAQVPEIAS